MDEFGSELYSDFSTYHGKDLLDIFRGRITPKLALALVELLPLDSAFMTAHQGGQEAKGWDRAVYMQADVIDAITHLTHITIQANSDRKKKVPDPKPYPRPNGEKPEPDVLLKKLRGEKTKQKVGPGVVIPLN